MEKQPVDDLFARKLRDAEALVGPDVFNQLQQRMGAKPAPVRRPVAVWRYVVSAACVLLALNFLYIASSTERAKDIAHAQKPLSTNKAAEETPLVGDSKRQQRQGRKDKDQARSDSQESKSLAGRTTTYPANKRSELPKGQLAKQVAPAETSEPLEHVAVIQSENSLPVPNPSTIAANLVPVERVVRVSPVQKQPVERTIVLTIDEQPTANSLASVQSEPSALNTQQPKQNSLSGLFGKLKQLKNGEVLAKAAPVGGQPNQKVRLNRVFNEVKESLKNETTLE